VKELNQSLERRLGADLRYGLGRAIERMTEPIFCCDSIQPHKPIRTDHDPKFNAFRNAAMNNDVRGVLDLLEDADLLSDSMYVIQVVRKFDLSTIQWTRFFTNSNGEMGRRGGFVEIDRRAWKEVEKSWVQSEAFKNFSCKIHCRIFQLSLFEKTG
jgi:hypothetical protein